MARVSADIELDALWGSLTRMGKVDGTEDLSDCLRELLTMAVELMTPEQREAFVCFDGVQTVIDDYPEGCDD